MTTTTKNMSKIEEIAAMVPLVGQLVDEKTSDKLLTPAGSPEKALPDALNPHKWKPGVSGNPSGRPKSKPITDEIKKQLLANDGDKLKKLVDAVIAKALDGSVEAQRLLMERVEGKIESDGSSLTFNGPTVVRIDVPRPQKQITS